MLFTGRDLGDGTVAAACDASRYAGISDEIVRTTLKAGAGPPDRHRRERLRSRTSLRSAYTVRTIQPRVAERADLSEAVNRLAAATGR
jgi:hypothetical protein